MLAQVATLRHRAWAGACCFYILAFLSISLGCVLCSRLRKSSPQKFVLVEQVLRAAAAAGAAAATQAAGPAAIGGTGGACL